MPSVPDQGCESFRNKPEVREVRRKQKKLSQQETPNSVCERAIVELKEAAAVMKEAHFVT